MSLSLYRILSSQHAYRVNPPAVEIIASVLTAQPRSTFLLSQSQQFRESLEETIKRKKKRKPPKEWEKIAADRETNESLNLQNIQTTRTTQQQQTTQLKNGRKT